MQPRLAKRLGMGMLVFAVGLKLWSHVQDRDHAIRGRMALMEGLDSAWVETDGWVLASRTFSEKPQPPKIWKLPAGLLDTGQLPGEGLADANLGLRIRQVIPQAQPKYDFPSVAEGSSERNAPAVRIQVSPSGKSKPFALWFSHYSPEWPIKFIGPLRMKWSQKGERPLDRIAPQSAESPGYSLEFWSSGERFTFRALRSDGKRAERSGTIQSFLGKVLSWDWMPYRFRVEEWRPRARLQVSYEKAEPSSGDLGARPLAPAMELEPLAGGGGAFWISPLDRRMEQGGELRLTRERQRLPSSLRLASAGVDWPHGALAPSSVALQLRLGSNAIEVTDRTEYRSGPWSIRYHTIEALPGGKNRFVLAVEWLPGSTARVLAVMSALFAICVGGWGALRARSSSRL